MFGSKEKTSEDLNGKKYASTISEDMVLRGEVTFNDGCFFNGTLKGVLRAGADLPKGELLVVGPESKIEGDLYFTDGYVMGNIKGNIHSSGTIYLLEGCVIQGDLHYNKIVMSHGAKVEGRFVHSDSDSSKVPAGPSKAESVPVVPASDSAQASTKANGKADKNESKKFGGLFGKKSSTKADPKDPASGSYATSANKS